MDNSVKIWNRNNSSENMKHHLARLAMMMAEERGEELSYEEALKL